MMMMRRRSPLAVLSLLALLLLVTAISAEQENESEGDRFPSILRSPEEAQESGGSSEDNPAADLNTQPPQDHWVAVNFFFRYRLWVRYGNNANGNASLETVGDGLNTVNTAIAASLRNLIEDEQWPVTMQFLAGASEEDCSAADLASPPPGGSFDACVWASSEVNTLTDPELDASVLEQTLLDSISQFSHQHNELQQLDDPAVSSTYIVMEGPFHVASNVLLQLWGTSQLMTSTELLTLEETLESGLAPVLAANPNPPFDLKTAKSIVQQSGSAVSGEEAGLQYNKVETLITATCASQNCTDAHLSAFLREQGPMIAPALLLALQGLGGGTYFQLVTRIEMGESTLVEPIGDTNFQMPPLEPSDNQVPTWLVIFLVVDALILVATAAWIYLQTNARKQRLLHSSGKKRSKSRHHDDDDADDADLHRKLNVSMTPDTNRLNNNASEEDYEAAAAAALATNSSGVNDSGYYSTGSPMDGYSMGGVSVGGTTWQNNGGGAQQPQQQLAKDNSREYSYENQHVHDYSLEK